MDRQSDEIDRLIRVFSAIRFDDMTPRDLAVFCNKYDIGTQNRFVITTEWVEHRGGYCNKHSIKAIDYKE